jgi:ABC-type sugar transport system substrate-binding protein
VGTDGLVKMVKAVEDGKLSATVPQNPYAIGYMERAENDKYTIGLSTI